MHQESKCKLRNTGRKHANSSLKVGKIFLIMITQKQKKKTTDKKSIENKNSSRQKYNKSQKTIDRF